MRLIARYARASHDERENALKATVEAGRGLGETPPRIRFRNFLFTAVTLHRRVLYIVDADSEVRLCE